MKSLKLLFNKKLRPYSEYDDKWISFYWGNVFDISYEVAGYFDARSRIRIALGFFSLTIILPIWSKWTDECDPPKYGFAIHNATVWIYRGGKGNFNGGNKWWTWHIPFLTKKWVRTSILLKDGTWEHETPEAKKNFYTEMWKSKQRSWDYNYTDSFDGEIIPTTVYVDEREWRPKWLTWTKLFAKISKTIDVHFSKEVGKGKGSWKGGTLRCGYEMRPNETAIECLMRMEKERVL